LSGRFPDAETLAICERFSLWLRQGGGFRVRGRPLPGGRAAGQDFEGFADYQPGDDLRHVEWPLYARTGELYVRTFADEGAGLVAVLLDASGSMAVGAPPKWELARRVAAALAFAALRELHQVIVGVMQGPKLLALPVLEGVGAAQRVFDFLAQARPAGPTDLGAAMGSLAVGGARGDAVVVSDFLDPRGADRGLQALAARGVRADLCRVVAPGEFDLPPAGAVLRDPEGAAYAPVPRDAAGRAPLARAIEAHRGALLDAARRHRAPLVELGSELGLSAALERYFRRIAGARGLA
jgi:uncharacterized protein (DUF58 family)